MRKLFFLLAILVQVGLANGQEAKYQVSLDLINVIDDQVKVTIIPPKMEEDVAEYHMAKIVPGTYSISDFGRFVVDFQAFDSEGGALEVNKVSTNKWQISNARALAKLTYKVHDTFDAFEAYDGGSENIVFEPGGTNIEPERNVFVINTFGFVGYFKGHKFHPYELTISHKEEVEGATALEKVGSTETTDTYTARDFNFLADGPLMYSVPDIATKKLANAEILVSVFSPNKALSAQDVMDKISDLMEAQSKYLGGELPVERYAYLIYLLDGPTLSGAMGALEHSYSSVYSLPEGGADQIGQTVRDVAAHEFFHIVTPLNIHSEQIGNFDYIDPKMSKHLWLYEGCTEYAAMHVQAKYGLYDGDKFLEEIQDKMRTRDQFPKDVPFTVMSERILEEKYEPMYSNVYYKGALIGMCLDLQLLKLSDGKYDLQNLMRDLAEKYGPEKSFEDDKLFDEIVALTYPEIGDFLRTYVSGEEELPLQEYLRWAGIDYEPERQVETFSLGQIGLNVNEDREIFVTTTASMNDFGKAMGYEEGDVLKSINGEEISLATIERVLGSYGEGMEEGDKVKVEVYREVNGKRKRLKLKAKSVKTTRTERHFLKFTENPSEDQQYLRDSWLNAN
ncbi:MAG: peptidase M61 [Cytophagales bacterium]|nr:peptidase M61 [Cytophagales bacterium]